MGQNCCKPTDVTPQVVTDITEGKVETKVTTQKEIQKETPKQARTPVDYADINSLWFALETDAVRMVSARWIIELFEKGGTMPRRQDCPEEAFLSLSELKQLYEDSTCTPKDSSNKRAPILVVSHFWRERGNPDPKGVTLKKVAEGLKNHLEITLKPLMRKKKPNVGVFFDWMSLYQEPRATDEMKKKFKASLSWINLWYAHALTTCILIMDKPDGKDVVPYQDRGWTSFEYQLSWLIKLSHKKNVYKQVWDFPRPALVSFDAFQEGKSLGTKIFTNGADRGLVAGKFEEAYKDIFGSAVELDYSYSKWDDKSFATLGEFVLPLCPTLKSLDLSGNELKNLADNIANCQSLERLILLESQKLESLPETIGQLKNLKELKLGDCRNLAKLPQSFGQLNNLETLFFLSTPKMATPDSFFPFSFGSFKNLKELAFNNCTKLNPVPAGITECQSLEYLSFSKCGALTSLPKDLGKFKNVWHLNLRSCKSLKEIPESIGEMKSLRDLDLSYTDSIKPPSSLKNCPIEKIVVADAKWGKEGMPEVLKSFPQSKIKKKLD